MSTATENNGTTGASEPVVIKGKVHQTGFDPKKKRSFMQVTMLWGDLRRITERRLFSGTTGRGEQRNLVPSQVTKLNKALKGETYTPTSWSLQLTKKQRERLSETDKHGFQALEINPDDPKDKIPLIDGGHRNEAYTRYREELLEQAMADLEDGAELDESEVAELVDSQPVPVIIYLDGDPQEDFLNLNSHLAINKAQMFAIQVKKGVLPNSDSLKHAINTLKEMNNDQPKSWLTSLVVFDSSTSRTNKRIPRAAMPVTSLVSKGSSDGATSVQGGSKICIHFDRDVEFLAMCYRFVYDLINEHAPELLKPGMMLCPPPLGTKAGATYIIGLGNMLAYYLCAMEKEHLDEDEVKWFLKCVKDNFEGDADGNTGADTKRSTMGTFAQVFFEPYNTLNREPAHQDVPMGLVKILNPGALKLDKLPKPAKGNDNTDNGEEGGGE
jgi:hypothetical protein